LIHINCDLRDRPLSIVNGGFLLIIVPLASNISTHAIIYPSDPSTVSRRVLVNYSVRILVFDPSENYFRVCNSNRRRAKRRGVSLE
jgi:hypothetical protein